MRLWRRYRPVLFYQDGLVDPYDLKEWPGPVIPVCGNPSDCVAVAAVKRPWSKGAPDVQAVSVMSEDELDALIASSSPAK